ncbi:MAG: hypothetical protein JHC33_14630 [Ignisphaera sp.]|nr:hypothetical protein [Ignisphaera sp.]
MRVTVTELINCGANISRGYLWRFSTPVAYRCEGNTLRALFETNAIKKAIEAKAYCHIGNENVTISGLKKFNIATASILKAITKMEKKNANKHRV